MEVREYTDSDLDEIKRIHGDSGLEYDFPDTPSQVFFSRRVVSDGSGIGMAAFLRLTAEAYLVANPRWRTAAWRGHALTQLHRVCHGDAVSQGVQEVNAFLAPPIVKKFGRRLERMGWKKYQDEEWRCFSYEINHDHRHVFHDGERTIPCTDESI